MFEQVEEAIEIVKNQKNSWEIGSMTHREGETVLNCLYRLRRILEMKELSRSEPEELYD